MNLFSLTSFYTRSLVIAVILISSIDLTAQVLPQDTTAKESDIHAWPKDSLGRRTPRGAVEGFIKAISLQEYNKAGSYLKLDSSIKNYQDTAHIVKGFQYLLEKNGRLFPYSRISDEPNGVEDD